MNVRAFSLVCACLVAGACSRDAAPGPSDAVTFRVVRRDLRIALSEKGALKPSFDVYKLQGDVCTQGEDDKCAIDEVVAKTVKGGDKFSAMVLAVVESDPFQKRRGKRSE